MKIRILFILLLIIGKSAYSQTDFLFNQYGYFRSMDKIVALKSQDKLVDSSRFMQITQNEKKVNDSLIYNGQLNQFYIYGINLSSIKTNGNYNLNSNGTSQSILITKNPYSNLYQNLHAQILKTVTDDITEENFRQLLSLMYISFTDSVFSNNSLLVEKLLGHAATISTALDDKTINKEKNIKTLLLASTCMSMASFAEQDFTAKRNRATLAMKLYIKAVEHNEITQNLDLKGTAAFQLYLIFKDPSHLKELIHVLDKMTWPQDFKSEDMRLYFLLHFANVYNITDGFLVKNSEPGIHTEKNIISNTPKIYKQDQLIDYSLSSLYTFQAIKDVKYVKQLKAGLNYMSGLNISGTNYFAEILKSGSPSEKRKLLLLLNNISLMI